MFSFFICERVFHVFPRFHYRAANTQAGYGKTLQTRYEYEDQGAGNSFQRCIRICYDDRHLDNYSHHPAVKPLGRSCMDGGGIIDFLLSQGEGQEKSVR